MRGCYGCYCCCCSCGCSKGVQINVGAAGVPCPPGQAQEHEKEQIIKRGHEQRTKKQACCCCSRRGSGYDMADDDNDDDDDHEEGGEEAAGRSRGEAKIRTSYCCCRRQKELRRRCDCTRGGEGDRAPPIMASTSDDRVRPDPVNNDRISDDMQQQQQQFCNMRLVQVRCSVPPDDAASFPRLAVARKLIHTHTSTSSLISSSSSSSSSSSHSSFSNSTCRHCGHGCCGHTSSRSIDMNRSPCTSQLPALNNWPPQPSLIINHTCPCSSSSSSPPSIQQQILFTDAATTCSVPPSSTSGSIFTEVDHQYVSHGQEAAMPASSSCNTSPTTSAARVKEEKQAQPLCQSSEADHQQNTERHQDDTSRDKTPESISHDGSIIAAAEDGVLLAAVLIRHFKEGLMSSSSSSPSAAKHDWDAIVASKEFDRFLSTLRDHGAAPRPPWLADGPTFKRAMTRIMNYAGASYNRPERRRHRRCLEDLLQSIESFEKMGLIPEMARLGLHQEAHVLRDRAVFFDVLARARVQQEACALLHCIRGRMGLPRGHSWSLACSNNRCRSFLQQMSAACGSLQETKTFAWNLDKVELVAKDISTSPCPQAYKEQNSTSTSMRVEKLLTSPLAPFFGGLCAISHLKNALFLLQHHIIIMKALHTNGFCSVKTHLPDCLMF